MNVMTNVRDAIICRYGTRSRTWHTLFDMTGCMLIESELPKELWTYAAQTATVVKNRCFNKHTKQGSYQMLTGRRPDLSRMQKLGLCVMLISKTTEMV